MRLAIVLVCLFGFGAHAVSLHGGVLGPGTQSDMEKHARSPETIKIKFQCGQGDDNNFKADVATQKTLTNFASSTADATVPFKGVDSDWVKTQCDAHCGLRFCVVLPVAGESLTMETIRLVNEKSAQEAERRHNFAMRPKIIKGVKLQCGAPQQTDLDDRVNPPKTFIGPAAGSTAGVLTVFDYLEDTDREDTGSNQQKNHLNAREQNNAASVWLDAGSKQKEFVDQACAKYCGPNRFCNLLEGLEDIKVFVGQTLAGGVAQESGNSKTDEGKTATNTQTGADHYVVTVPRKHIPNLG